MNYSNNPFAMMMNMGQNNPIQQMMKMGQPQSTPINRQQLQSGLGKLTKNDLANIVKHARSQGMSEQDIEAGLNFILSLY